MLQHVVPQTYLKRFAVEDNNNKKKYFVFAYDKREDKCWNTNINQVAAQTDFYQLKKASNINCWEEIYSRFVEQDLNQLLSDMIARYEPNVFAKEAIVFEDRDKVRIALHIISQLFRGMAALDYEKSIRPFLKQTIRKEALELAKEYGIDSVEVDRCLEDEDLWRVSYAKQAINHGNHILLLQQLVNRIWILYKSTDDSFITSDSPVLYFNQNNNLVGEFKAGIGYKSTVVFLPISSRLCIGMYTRDELYPFLNIFDNKMAILSGKDEAFIDRVNLLQFRQCNRQVFAKEEEKLLRLIRLYKQQINGGCFK